MLNTRLAVIDLTTGDQPIANESGTVVCTFNGEIYNFKELRKDLEHAGHKFRTSGDTEVLVHLYEEHGIVAGRYLRGMYAFAILDNARRSVHLFRDRLGQKPLYVAEYGGGIAYSSSIRSLLDVGISRDLSNSALVEYLQFYKVAEPRTIYLNISCLLPGQVLSIDLTTGGTRRSTADAHWPLEQTDDSGEAVASAREAFDRAIERHLVADVEVAAFLSGGVDSSLVAAEAQKRMSRPLRTFCVGFPDDTGADESAYASHVASVVGTQHETVWVQRPLTDLLREAVRAAEQPFAVASFLPLLVLAEHASKQVKVVLTGDGGDEIGLGYPWYRWIQGPLVGRSVPGRRILADVLAATERGAGSRASASMRPVRRAAKYLRGALAGGARASNVWRYDLSYDEAAALVVPDRREDARSSVACSPMELAWNGDGVKALQRADIEVLLRDEMLPKLDRASMAHGLEGRVPLLDEDFGRAMLRLPAQAHLGGPSGKAVLRSWARDSIPGVSFERPKHGFDVPIRKWLDHGLQREVNDLLHKRSASMLFDREEARGVAARARAGVPGAAHTLYAMVFAECWWQEGAEVD